jgi:hypothetical protein
LHDPAEDLGDGIFIEQSLPVRVAADQAGRQTATDGRERVYTPGHATIFFFALVLWPRGVEREGIFE